jgi:hypothetical protein
LEIHSASQRYDGQVQRAAIYDSTGRKDDATLLREIRHSEQMTETYCLFNYIRKEKDNSGQTKIEVPHDWHDPNTPFAEVQDLTDPKAYAQQPAPQWRLITKPDKINYYLLLRNRRHFGQANGTPFTQEPFAPAVDTGQETMPTSTSFCRLYSTNKPTRPHLTRSPAMSLSMNFLGNSNRGMKKPQLLLPLLKGHFFGLWSNPVARGTGFLQFGSTIRHF